MTEAVYDEKVWLNVTNPESVLIPLYIGITGHRDIREEDKPHLKTLIKGIINQKIEQCPCTPVVILTPLAEGADRLAAYAARECGISYIAPLPMPVDEYRKDFSTPESLNEFNELLEGSAGWFELPLPSGTKVEELQDRQKRDEQYYQIGSYIARQSQLLIALWDGSESNKKGGTAHIVKLKRTGLPSVHPHFQQHLKNLQTGPIYHILTPRRDGVPPADAFNAKMIYSDYGGRKVDSSAETDNQLLLHIDYYNRDVKKLTPGLQEKIAQSMKALFTRDEFTEDNDQLLHIARFHAVTDIFASYFQAKRFFALRVLLTLAVVAFMFFQVYVEFLHRPLLLLLYPLTIGLGAVWFYHASKKRYEQKHEDYRALSEAFRVQYFLTITERGAIVSEYYLQKHKGELEWIIYALRAALLKSIGEMKPEREDHEMIMQKYRYLNTRWVIDQLNYYKKTGNKYDHLHDSHRRRANRFFAGAISAAIILFLISTFFRHFPVLTEEGQETIHSILVICTHSFLVISAAILGYNEKMIYAEQSKTCTQMAQLLSIANEKLTRAIDAGNQEEAREIIWELALESLMENADWLLLHRSRPMEMPKG